MNMGNVVMRFFKLVTRKKAEVDDCILYISSLKTPTAEEAMLFLNHVYSDEEYSEVLNIEEVTQEEAESAQYFDADTPLVTNFYEICANNMDGEEMICVTSIDGTVAPSPDVLMQCINFSRTEVEKITRINWVRKIDMKDAVTRYNMSDWMMPCEMI